jgi:hypothetical protein
LKSWFDTPFMYRYDSIDDSFDDFVGNHKVLLVKSLSKIPVPINFFACVTKNELGTIDSFSSEFLENHRCCLAKFKLFSILNENVFE